MKDRWHLLCLHLLRSVQLMWMDMRALHAGLEPWENVERRVQDTCDAYANAERAFDAMLAAANDLARVIAQDEPWTREEQRLFTTVNILAMPIERPPEVAAWMFSIVGERDKDCPKIRIAHEARLQAYAWHQQTCEETAATAVDLRKRREAVRDRRN